MADQFRSPGVYVQLNTPAALVLSSGGGGDPGTGLMEDDRWTLGPPFTTPVLQNSITISFVSGQDQDLIVSGIGPPPLSTENAVWLLSPQFVPINTEPKIFPFNSGADQDIVVSTPSATLDTLQDVFAPVSQAEFTALGLVTPYAIHLCQESSGDLADSTGGGFTLVASGSPSYNTVVSGWTNLGVSCADLGGSFSVSTGPNPASESFMWLLYYSILAGPAIQRDFVACYTSTVTARVTTTPRWGCHNGGNIVNGTFTPIGSGPVMLQYNKTAGSTTLYTLNEKLVVTFTSEVSIVFKMLGGNAATVMRSYMFRGANAELTSTQANAFFVTLGNGHWSPPWS